MCAVCTQCTDTVRKAGVIVYMCMFILQQFTLSVVWALCIRIVHLHYIM